MGPQILFNGKDIYDFVEGQKDKLKAAYEALPDEKALDEAFTQDLKKKYMLDVPRLKTDEWTYEQREISPHSIEIVVYIPFDGDPTVFGIRPSAFKSTVAQGEIVHHDLLIRVNPISADFDMTAYVKRQVGEVEWRLSSLRGTMEHMNQQLESTIRTCIARRKRVVENTAKIGQNIGIPLRQPPVAPVPKIEPKTVSQSKATNQPKSEPETWDIFMSHASVDKPYVEPLVEELKKAGVKVWYDKHVLSWGEHLRPGINKGLVNSSYAIVVLSKAFLTERKWTEHELNGLFAREDRGELIILPIWHGISKEDLLKYDPALADRLAKISDTDSYPDIVASVLQKLGRRLPQGDGVERHAKEPKPAKIPQQAIKQVVTVRNLVTGLSINKDLNPKEVELLWNTAKSAEGQIYHSSSFDGESIRANGRDFLSGEDARAASEWLSALRGLENRGMIEPLSDDRDFFRLTGEGYAAADQLEDFARWDAHSITLRAYYMNADPKELTLACKGIVAIPATYYPDQIGADGWVQRSVKEVRSLLVEDVDSMPNIGWQPTDVEFRDDTTGTVQNFRVDGVQYIRPSKLKLAIAG